MNRTQSSPRLRPITTALTPEKVNKIVSARTVAEVSSNAEVRTSPVNYRIIRGANDSHILFPRPQPASVRPSIPQISVHAFECRHLPSEILQRSMITSTYFASSSISRACRIVFPQAISVEPEPPHKPRTKSPALPLFSSARSINATGLCAGCNSFTTSMGAGRSSKQKARRMLRLVF